MQACQTGGWPGAYDMTWLHQIPGRGQGWGRLMWLDNEMVAPFERPEASWRLGAGYRS